MGRECFKRINKHGKYYKKFWSGSGKNDFTIEIIIGIEDRPIPKLRMK